MKCYWKTLVISGLLLTVFNLAPQCCNAQIGDPGEDPDAPIDGGVGILIAAGVGYGLKKYKDAGRSKKTVGL